MPGRLTTYIIFALLFMSCSGKIDKPGKSNTIPENDFIAILTEINIADGLLANPKVKNWVPEIDSVTTYQYIAEKHGYTKEAFEKTVNYYFVRKPKKLMNIYDKILAKLSEMESHLDIQARLEKEHMSNIWPGERNYYFPDIHEISSTDFRLTLNGNKPYVLRFTATLFPDDESVNPKTTVTAFAADSIFTGKKYIFQSTPFLKDGEPHLYSIRIFVTTPGAVQLEGSLLDNFETTGLGQKHVYLEGITLSIPSSDI